MAAGLPARRLKRKAREALAADDWRARLEELAESIGQGGTTRQHLITALLAALSSGQIMVRWRAVSFLGRVVAELAESEPEAAREVMRRLVWGLNEESGAVAWGAPEALGEIMAQSQLMADEFANILMAYVSKCDMALCFAPLRAGAVWGLGRLAEARPELMRERCAEEPLLALSGEDDPQVRGLAVWALGWLGGEKAAERLTQLESDEGALEIHENDELRTTSVGKLASIALERF
jgi:HEAT repeat protein